MNTDGTLGALLQGVSQQPPAIRQEGKVTEQINLVSDIVQGLTSRPAAEHIAYITNQPADLTFFKAIIQGTTYTVGYKAGYLMAYDESGVVYPCSFQDAAAQAYVGSDMRGYVYDNALYLTNRVVITKAAIAAVPATTNGNTGVVFCLGGLFSRTYTVALRYLSGMVATGTYSTPDGNSDGDAQKTSSIYITHELQKSLRAHPNYGNVATTVITVGNQDNVAGQASAFAIQADTPFTLTTEDGEDRTSLRNHVLTATSVSNLSEFAPHGTLVRITGSDEGSADDYFLRFNSEITDFIGAGFGRPGVWEEWFDPSQVTTFDLTTMPHVLELVGGAFIFRRGTWTPRQVGDEDTNGFPDFIGHPIRDIGGFQSRLVYAAGPWACMSTSKEPLNFFKKSALTELATDPIGVSSTKEGEFSLDWIIPFDKDLLFMSDPGAGQFVISGGSELTPANASIVQTTAFDMRGGAAPVQTGKTVVFPFKSGKYSGINEFFTNSEVTTNGVDTITETLDRYILGLVDHMVCSTNFNTLLLKTDAAETSNTVWVYKYLWQGTDKRQSSWGKWVFTHEVKFFYFANSDVFLTLYDPITGDYSHNRMDLDRTADSLLDYHVCLDERRSVEVADSTVVLPFPNAGFAQSTGTAAIGRDAEPVSSVSTGVGEWTYTFREDHIANGVSLIAGIRFERSCSPTMPFLRDRDGNVRAQAKLTVLHFYIDYNETGYVEAVMRSPYRDTLSMIEQWFPTADDPRDLNETGIRSGVYEVPWGERADWSTLEIRSSDIRPTTILEVQWDGQPYKV